VFREQPARPSRISPTVGASEGEEFTASLMAFPMQMLRCIPKMGQLHEALSLDW